MLSENFVYLAFAMSMIGTGMYIHGIIKGTVKPNKMTWFLLGLAPMLSFAAQLYEGVGIQSLHSFSAGFGPLVIVFISLFYKKAYWKLVRFDYLMGSISVIGLILWLITGQGILAIIFAIIADFTALIPMVVKLYKHPETERGAIFGIGALSATLVLLTIDNYRFEEYGFSLYILLICLVMFYPTARLFLENKLMRQPVAGGIK